MNANSYVRLVNDDVWSVRPTGGTSTLIADTGASETYRRPHAPRPGKPKNAALTGLHFDISSTSELRNSATQRPRISDCGHSSLRLIDRIRASYKRRIRESPTNQVSKIRHPILSPMPCASGLPLPASSVDYYNRRQLAAYCRPKSMQLRSKRRVDSAQTKSIPGPVPRAVHRVDFTPLQLAPTMTHVSKQLSESVNNQSAHHISRN